MRAYAKAYLKTSGIAEPVVSITLKYAQLVKRKQGAIIAGLASASLCDTVSVEFPRYGISVKAKIIKVVYNTLKERYEEAEIGKAKSRLSQTVNNSRVDPDEIVKKATTDSKKTAADLIDAASKEIVESITGSNGGYVVQRPAKNPQETLYMDTPDVTTAKNVMRLNKDGIAFSTNGVGGPYSGALAINGKWFSQFIATWELTANIIKAGILQDAVGKNSINLDTGEVNLDCKSLKIQGKTTEEIAAGKASEAETSAKKAAADELNAYKEAVTKDLADMQGQIDGQIETWFYDAEPSPTTPPASDWTTDELKENHAGDLYYSGKGYAYRWTYSGGAWTWLQIKDTDITAALQNAKRAQETANSKRRTFLVRPTPPYDIGDLWANGTDLLACVTARGEGASYSANDWEIKTDYTTKKTAQLIVDASIEKIELGIAEDVSATDFFSTAAWKAEKGSYTATSGSVTIAGDTATVVAPDSTETGKRRAVVIDVPTAMLAATQGKASNAFNAIQGKRGNFGKCRDRIVGELRKRERISPPRDTRNNVTDNPGGRLDDGDVELHIQGRKADASLPVRVPVRGRGQLERRTADHERGNGQKEHDFAHKGRNHNQQFRPRLEQVCDGNRAQSRA